MTNLDVPDLPPLPPKKRRGCLFYGCITAVVLFLALGIGGYFLVRYGIDKVVTTIEQYSETSPMALPQSTMADADYRQLEQRIATWNGADAGAGATPQLSLSSDDVNALIARDPAWQMLRDKVYVTMVDGRVQAQVALPLDGMAGEIPGFSRLKNRFVNADVALQVSLAGDRVAATLSSVRIKGEEMPAEFMAGLRSENLLERMAGPNLERLKERIESFHVDGDKLVIVKKTL